MDYLLKVHPAIFGLYMILFGTVALKGTGVDFSPFDLMRDED